MESELYALDYSENKNGTCTKQAFLKPASIIHPINTITSTSNLDNHNFLFMQGSSVTVANNMVHSLAMAIGIKQSAIFVDACFAEIFEELSERSRQRYLFVGKLHAVWLRKSLGMLKLIHEVSCIVYH